MGGDRAEFGAVSTLVDLSWSRVFPPETSSRNPGLSPEALCHTKSKLVALKSKVVALRTP
jgi:hypothetical protein